MTTLSAVLKFLKIDNKHVFKVVKHLTTSSHRNYAGHSKWSNIKHIKAEKDNEKSGLFQKISRQIKLAIHEGGGNADPEYNASLRNIIDYAIRKNMPASSIDSVIKKATQSKSVLKKYHVNIRYKQRVYMLCVVYTDNFTMTKMEMAPALRKVGATMIESNSFFDEYCIIEAIFNRELPTLTKVKLEDLVTEDAIECGAEDIEIIDSASRRVHFICKPEHLLMLQGSIHKKGYLVEFAEHYFLPRNTIQLPPEELDTYYKFTSKLHQISGVESIHDNIELNA